MQVNLRVLGLRNAHVGGRYVEPGAHAAFHALLHFVAVGLQRGNLGILHLHALAHEQDVVVHLRGAEGQVAAGYVHVVLGGLHLGLGQLHGGVALAKVQQQVLGRDVGVVIIVGGQLQRFAAKRQLHHRVDAGVGGRAGYLGQEAGARLRQTAVGGVGQLVERSDGRVGIEHRAQRAVQRQRIGNNVDTRCGLRVGGAGAQQGQRKGEGRRG